LKRNPYFFSFFFLQDDVIKGIACFMEAIMEDLYLGNQLLALHALSVIGPGKLSDL